MCQFSWISLASCGEKLWQGPRGQPTTDCHCRRYPWQDDPREPTKFRCLFGKTMRVCTARYMQKMIWYDPQKKTYHPPPKKCISLRWVKAAWRAAALAEDSSASLVASPTCCRCQRSKCCGAPLGQVMGVIAGWVIMENPIKIDDLTHFRKPRGGILSWVITGLGTN